MGKQCFPCSLSQLRSAPHIALPNGAAGGSINGIVLDTMASHSNKKLDGLLQMGVISVNMGLVVLAKTVRIDCDSPYRIVGVRAVRKGSAIYKL